MYTLYYSPGACSLAIHTILNIIGHPPRLKLAGKVPEFEKINPSCEVPVLQFGDTYLTEGAAIILYVTSKHNSALLPQNEEDKRLAIQNLMLANASIHPAYNKLFFASANLPEGDAKSIFMNSAVSSINTRWGIVENAFRGGNFLGGNSPSPADILLAVYSRWGALFDVDINIGRKTRMMIERVINLEPFLAALERENADEASYVQ